MTAETPTLVAIRERAQPLIAYYSTLPADEAVRDLCERFTAGQMVDDWRIGRVTELTRELDATRAELARLRPVADAARRLRNAAREQPWVPDAVDGAIGDVAAAVDALDSDAPKRSCAGCGHRRDWHQHGRCVGDLLHCECVGYVAPAGGRPAPAGARAPSAEERLASIRAWMATYPALPADHDGPLDGETLFVRQLREFLGTDSQVGPERCTCDYPGDPHTPHRPWCATQHQHPGPDCAGLCEPATDADGGESR